MHALSEYGLMHVKLYEDIARHGHIATAYAYPVQVDSRYVMDPSPIPKFDNPKLSGCPALQLFGAGREKRIYAIPPYTMSDRSTSRTILSSRTGTMRPVKSVARPTVISTKSLPTMPATRMFVCSDTDYCEQRRDLGPGAVGAPTAPDVNL